MATPAALAMIRALIPLGLKAVEEALDGSTWRLDLEDGGWDAAW